MRVRELLTMFMKQDSDNYPETLGCMMVINAPSWFSSIFGAIKSLMAGDTAKKIQVGGAQGTDLLFIL